MKCAFVVAMPHQRGFWIDRVSDDMMQVGLGQRVLVMDLDSRPDRSAIRRRWRDAWAGLLAVAVTAIQDIAGLLA